MREEIKHDGVQTDAFMARSTVFIAHDPVHWRMQANSLATEQYHRRAIASKLRTDVIKQVRVIYLADCAERERSVTIWVLDDGHLILGEQI